MEWAHVIMEAEKYKICTSMKVLSLQVEFQGSVKVELPLPFGNSLTSQTLQLVR